ncbi:hypothetical protein Pcinc_040466 [Petrolisthes cinctipes]|uniref:Uncharacterized protein n=1 Tax=Petrolisthes cinctipes TaxID=88211 RepID=A0AAE1BLW8_PETCI|nr:hypothetical protein Pcinc_040466 [Petrolisthes cinctipes]
MSQGNPPTPTAQTHHTPLTTQGNEPSLRFPTRDYLEKTFNKPDLQKWCRELGLTKVWVTKDELIKMILQNCQSKPRAPDEQDPALTPGDIIPAPTSLGDSWQVPPSFGNSPSASRPPNDPETPTTLSGLLPSGWCEITFTPPNVSESPSPPTDNPETDPTPSDDSRSALPPSNNLPQAPPVPTASDDLCPPSTSPVSGQTTSTHPDIRHTVSASHYITKESEATQIDVQKLTKDIATIMMKLETKDLEIELMSTEIKAAYATIENLQKRVSDLEQQTQKRSNQSTQAANPPYPTSSLLLGDNNLRRVLRSDLTDTSSVKTVTGANMDLLRSWVNEKLNRIPLECVIYGGMYDILHDVAPEIILDNLGCLISDLKEKNTDMKINVCQIVPTPMSHKTQVKIQEYNEQLEKWCETNGVTIINTVPTFRLGTGDIDDLCFETATDKAPLLLNRLDASSQYLEASKH